ncbi:MAG: Unknown protein [uncultured Sulfurovum sp.]|uniref:Lipoprotein n=1 Tax=uncultured Sulfurovum sp. TaxID=269237 RepID=A0A6S6TV28_9BACT|nr:MAG: Unknown protein [uncultured Sulfurovum sp.]
MTTIKTLSLTTIITLLLVGCANSKPVFTSSGTKGHSIDCSGELSTWGDCYEKVSELCGTKGYRILEKMEDKESSIFAGKEGLFGSSTHTRNLIIQCK